MCFHYFYYWNFHASLSEGYFLEVVIPICLFAKKPVDLTLTGTTNDETDVSVDTIRTVTLPMIKRQFGVEAGLASTLAKAGAAANA